MEEYVHGFDVCAQHMGSTMPKTLRHWQDIANQRDGRSQRTQFLEVQPNPSMSLQDIRGYCWCLVIILDAMASTFSNCEYWHHMNHDGIVFLVS